MNVLGEALESAIASVLGRHPGDVRSQPVGGGCINECYILEGDGFRYFMKANRADRRDMFEAEADGLRALAATGTLRVPLPLATGVAGHHAYVLLEALALGGRRNDARLGEQLAALHAIPGDRFGWQRDNFIGAMPQRNAADGDWPRFFAEQRLGIQFAWARARGASALADKGEQLLAEIGDFFEGHAPRPSLLHGDLWAGNADFLADGTPVIFDPAVYWGDREADIAMTELFGGFGPHFHAAYRATLPLDAGYPERRDLYNLYHIVNHFNLFGGGYADQAIRMIARLRSLRR